MKMNIRISRHYVSVGNVSLFLSLDCFRLRIYRNSHVIYTLTLWDKHCIDNVGLYKGHRRVL